MEDNNGLAQDCRVSRGAAIVALALCACQKAPPRIYTDKELAALENRVLAEVAKTDGSCAHHELLDLENAVDEPSDTKMSTLRSDLDVDSNVVAEIDEKCSAKVLQAFGRAAAATPSCSPYQVGVRGAPAISSRNSFRSYLGAIHATRVLAWHALRETDHYVGLVELLMALGVAEDMGRGRIDLLEAMKGSTMEHTIVVAAQKLLSQSSMTHEQLVDAAATLDAAMEHEPSFGSALQGDALSMALHVGVASLKPLDWQPPGGRTQLTAWKHVYAAASDHDPRDDAGAMMDISLRRLERNAKACPQSASLAICHANLASPVTPTEAAEDRELADKLAARVAMFPDDTTRHESQEQLIAAGTTADIIEFYIDRRAQTVSRFVALRLQLQVLLDGHCPGDAELGVPPWSALRAPAVLGDSVQVTRTADALLVEPPTWATTTKPTPMSPSLPKAQPVSIPCP